MSKGMGLRLGARNKGGPWKQALQKKEDAIVLQIPLDALKLLKWSDATVIKMEMMDEGNKLMLSRIEKVVIPINYGPGLKKFFSFSVAFGIYLWLSTFQWQGTDLFLINLAMFVVSLWIAAR